MAAEDAGRRVTEGPLPYGNSPVSVWAKYPGLTESKLFEEYIYRLTTGRDLHVVITAASETGVGKTTLAFALALLWDQTGWTVDKATLDPREYAVLYDEVGAGSVLILDEAEQAGDKRRGMSHENVELSHSFAAKRYRQVFGVLTAPTRSWIDNRLGEDSADYWIQCLETDKGEPKGEARVYRLKVNEHYETDYTKRTETITWPVLDHHPEFKKLEQKKVERMSGVRDSMWVHRDEVERLKKNYWNKATNMTRYHIIKGLAEHGMTHTKIADVLQTAENVEGISRRRVSQLVNTESFEEAYAQ